MKLPDLKKAGLIKEKAKRILIAAYGFEQRSLGWSEYQMRQGKILDEALIIKYEPGKGKNKISELRNGLSKIGIDYPKEIIFNVFESESLEKVLELQFKDINNYEEVIIDITAMTKYLILVCLHKLAHFKGSLRIIYTEAQDYSPSFKEYEQYRLDSSLVAHFPSQGFKKILRAKCLSSIRMQGQPVALVAFASFNEQLVRYMLGTISPYRLVFINGSPPRTDYEWREKATQFIHRRLIDDYRIDNQIDNKTGLLKRKASTLLYTETIQAINEIYDQFGMYERIIIAATGSKMQTVGLFFSKILHPDIHIEYPNPDSYYFDGMSKGVREIHEIIFLEFSDLINEIKPERKFIT